MMQVSLRSLCYFCMCSTPLSLYPIQMKTTELCDVEPILHMFEYLELHVIVFSIRPLHISKSLRESTAIIII